MPQPFFWLDRPSRVFRIVRLLWVLATTSIFVSFLFVSRFGQPFNREAQSVGLWVWFLLIAGVPVSGAILEVFASKFAKWINIGFWISLGVYYLVAAAFDWSDPFGPLVLLIGVALLIPAGINY